MKIIALLFLLAAQDAKTVNRGTNDDLAKLSPDLKSLTLIGWRTEITAEGFAHLAKLKKLKNLKLIHFETMPDAWLDPIAKLKLESLDLEGSYTITNEGLKKLKGLPLRSLGIAFCRKITDLPDFPDLESIDLRSSPFAGSLERFGKLRSVRGLRGPIPKLPNLEVLDVGFGKTNDLSAVAGMKKLKKLVVGFCADIDDDDVKHLAKLKLEELHLTRTKCTGAALRQVPATVKKLYLGGCRITESDAGSFKKFRNLTYINLHGTGVGNEVVKTLGALPLESIDLSHCPNVTRLSFGKLKRLDLRNCAGVTDETLADLPEVEDLHLRGCAITDDGVAALGDLKSLKTVDLGSNRRLTGRGLMALTKLKNLLHVNLTGCTNLDPKIEADFRKSRPDVRVTSMRRRR